MNHIPSPRTDDASIEQEIRAKGKIAARVTPADIEANIAECHYFTALDGVDGHFRGGPEAQACNARALGLLTFCVLVLRNGFTVTGESAPASPENFDPEIGRKIARQNAVQKVWPLMGYQLKEDLHRKAMAPGCDRVGRAMHCAEESPQACADAGRCLRMTAPAGP